MRLNLLGPLEVLVDGQPLTFPRARRRLVSILALTRNAALDSDRLADHMWGNEPPRTARNALQVHVSAIRRLAGDLVETTADGYRLTSAASLDVDEFEQWVAVSKQSEDWDLVRDACDAALELWRGAPFSELEGGAVVPEASRLSELRLELMERRAEALLAMGRAEEAVPDLESHVQEFPLRERFWEYLMLGRYRLGRQAEALRAFQDAAAVLGDQLGIEPGPRLKALEDEILLQAPDAGRIAHSNPHNLPRYANSIIGRDDELDRLTKMVGESRVVTVSGGPGLGKSRLAIEAGWELLEKFPGGVYLVSLADMPVEADIVASICTAMRVVDHVESLDRLAPVVADRPVLLILDNCDGVGPLLHEFLELFGAAGGRGRVITTTRRRIGADVGQMLELSPLSCEVEDPGDIGSALESPAVRLLIERARSASAAFRVSDANIAQLVMVAIRSGGAPLALELAARWIPTLGPDDVLRLDDLITGESVRRAIDLSYLMMTGEDQELLAAASVLASPSSLVTLHEVCAPGSSLIQVAGSVARLVESSLLAGRMAAEGRVVYSILEPVREYASQRLGEAGSRLDVYRRHAARFVRRSASLGESDFTAIDRVMPDFRNAMRFLLSEGDADDATAIAVSLRRYWDSRYLTWEAQRWLLAVLDAEPSVAARLEALWSLGWVAYNNHDYELARASYESCLELARVTGRPDVEGRALYGLGRIELPILRNEGETLLAEAEKILAPLGELETRAACLMGLGISRAWSGDAGGAKGYLKEALEALGEAGDARLGSICYRYLSLAAHHEGDAAEAERLSIISEGIARAADDNRGLSGALIQRAFVQSQCGELGSAAQLMIEALAPVPPEAEIDTALLFVGAAPVLVEAGEQELATELFGQIDRIYSKFGWAPIEDVNPVVADYRTRVGAVEGTHQDLAESRSELVRTLERISAG